MKIYDTDSCRPEGGAEIFPNMKIIPTLIVIVVAVVVAIAIRIFLQRNGANSKTENPNPSPVKPDDEPETHTAKPSEEPKTTSPPTEPPVPAAEAEQPATVVSSAPRVAPDGKPLILVAEDNPSNYKLVEVLLRNDYSLLHAENGVEAIALFREHRPALILMDISMPEMDGYEALQGVRSLDTTVPVIALTASAFETDKQKMKACGFNSSLAKPLNARELKQTIRRELGLDETQTDR